MKVFRCSELCQGRDSLSSSRGGRSPWVRAPRVGSVCRTREAERAVEVPRIEGSSEPPSCRGLGKHFDADIAHGKTSLPVWPSAL